MESIDLPDNLRGVGDWVFVHCSGLKGVSIPEGTTEIGHDVFCGCVSLASASLPGSMEREPAFEGCAERFALGVARDTYTARYAQDKGIWFVYRDELAADWTKQTRRRIHHEEAE